VRRKFGFTAAFTPKAGRGLVNWDSTIFHCFFVSRILNVIDFSPTTTKMRFNQVYRCRRSCDSSQPRNNLNLSGIWEA